MRIEPIRPDHLQRIIPRIVVGSERMVADLMAPHLHRLPDCFAGVVGQEVLGIAGVTMLWPGVGQGFMILSNLVKQYPFSFQRAMRRGMQVIKDRRGLWRIQADVHIDHPAGHKWLEALGFEYEGAMRMYGPDQGDYLRYARVWREE